ncbi:MAG: 50S ribosomal protein L23 [Gammaproteobacteria bacterium]|jgi:large subunit ribosomal protein L23
MNRERLMNVLLGPHVSEKSTLVADESNQIVFRVRRDASKQEIRQAVEMLFEVKVDGVQVVNLRGKRKRFGASVGRRSDWKKAYVKLAEGEELDFMGAE